MKRIIIIAFTLALVWGVAFNAHAQAPSWTLDPAHSEILFQVKHIYSKVNGHFRDFNATLAFDPDNLAQSSFDFSVKVKSVNTNISKRDNHLRSADFFDEKKYPEMTFKSTSIKHVNGDQYVVEGKLTVKDVTRTVSVPFTFFGTTPNPFNDKQLVAGFEARMSIARLDYHVGNGKFFKMGIVGNDVEVFITIEATRNP
jgi:polyisoprenoid-binding protein YceI